MSSELVSDTNDVYTNDANGVYSVALAPGPPERPRCAGTETSAGGPCEAPAGAEVDGLHLCARHAEEFGAEARADVLEVAASYLSRWLRVAREELYNDELVRRLEAAREGVEAEVELALGALERVGGDPRRCSPRPTGFGAGGAASRSEVGGTSSAKSTHGAARPRRERGGRR